MSIADFTLFLSITFVVSASPGPVMLSCMSNGGRYGMAKAIEGMVGASLGNLCLVALSAIGLGLIVSSNDLLFNSIKWLGAFYLGYLGIQLIRQPAVRVELGNATANPSRAIWLSSFLIAVSNPKGFIYFGALFPQFIDYDHPLTLQFGLLTITFLLTDMLWMLAYAALGKQIMTWLKTPKHQKLFNITSGLALMIAGLLVAITGKH